MLRTPAKKRKQTKQNLLSMVIGTPILHHKRNKTYGHDRVAKYSITINIHIVIVSIDFMNWQTQIFLRMQVDRIDERGTQ